jgi:hypothetical protein
MGVPYAFNDISITDIYKRKKKNTISLLFGWGLGPQASQKNALKGDRKNVDRGLAPK